MSAADVVVTLRVSGAEGAWVADVTFANKGPTLAPLYLPNLFEGGAVHNDVFLITTDGKEASYRLAYEKRRSPQPEDFVIVAPGAERRYAVPLDPAYAIPRAPGRRRAVYDAFHGDVQLWGGLWRLRSNEVVF